MVRGSIGGLLLGGEWRGRCPGLQCDVSLSVLLPRAYFPGQEQQVRLIYQGQLLRDDTQSLAALHLAHNSVLHCHISPHSSAPAPAGPRASADPAHAALDVGSLVLPLFVLMLAVLWYFQLQYRHVFTATATTFLAGLTLLFSFVAFTMYRR